MTLGVAGSIPVTHPKKINQLQFSESRFYRRVRFSGTFRKKRALLYFGKANHVAHLLKIARVIITDVTVRHSGWSDALNFAR